MDASRAAQFVEPLTQLALGERELAAGLRAVAEESTSIRLRRDLRNMAAHLERGGSLPEAFDAAPALAPPQVRELLAAGAASNRLADVLLAFGRHERRASEVTRRLRSTLLYPLILLSLLAIGTTLLLLFVVTPIQESLLAFDESVRGIDVAAAQAELEKLRPYRWPLLGTAAVMALVVAGLMLSSGVGRLGPMVRCLPLVGPIWHWLGWGQLLDLWALYLRAGVPLPRTLELAAQVLGDPALADCSDRWADGVARGESFGELLKCDNSIPPSVAALVAWGDAQGALPEATETAARYCRDRVESQFTFVELAVPPIALIVMVVGLGYLYSLLTGPLFTLRLLI